VVLFCSTIATFVFGIFGIINLIGQLSFDIVTGPAGIPDKSHPGFQATATNPILIIIFTILSIIIFSILISISIRTYRNNKDPRL
jgi:hypothetical protein